MSSALYLPLAVRRRLFVCADCRRWVAEQSLKQQRRGISRNGIRKIKIAEAEWAERRDAIEQGKAQSVLEHLEERGLVNQVVGNRDELNKVLVERRVGVYCGVDPTAPSLHIGHMVPFMALGWMFVYGYSSTYLVSQLSAHPGSSLTTTAGGVHRIDWRSYRPPYGTRRTGHGNAQTEYHVNVRTT